MYPMQGAMSAKGSMPAHSEPDEDERGGPSDYDADEGQGATSPPPTPGMQLAGMDPAMMAQLAGSSGDPGAIQSGLDPAMGGPGGAGQDQSLMMAKAQFQQVVQTMDMLAQSYPPAGEMIAQAQEIMLQALLQVGMAVQQVPTAPPVGV